VTEQEVLELIRRELLAILEKANELSRQGDKSSGFGTSEMDMSAGRGTITEYLIQVARERLNEGQKDRG
jgi:hypothetical protein